ncbi:3-oxoacyl-ACP reductase [Labrys miyagiensis]|uniref:3-oxoacyl-ACP reductase n=1 Tax=Labrys miyagiensis TaxID=346912 RepID=A0ABQ6CPH0_9HYPH|nr:3-oxoacyl-ACP reductase [Labrys miyagiensis]
MAERLASRGTHILVHGRDRDRAEQVSAVIRRAGGAASHYVTDLSSLSEVHGLAETIKRDHASLDILINNAGIGVGRHRGERQMSQDGYELRFAVNYLSGFLLTRLLLPIMTRRPGSKIINVSSAGQERIDFGDVMLTHGYDGRRAYCQSKLAQIMFTFDLAQELHASGVTANCLHPATYMDTAMVRSDGIRPMTSVDEGATAVLQLIDNIESSGKSGVYFDGMRPSRANGQAYDVTARARLRALSFQLVSPSAPALGVP